MCTTVARFPRPGRRAIVLAFTVGLGLVLAGCGSGSNQAPEKADATASASRSVALPPETRLAAFAARALDLTYTADYRYLPGGGGPAGRAHVVRTRDALRFDLTRSASASAVANTVSIVNLEAADYRCVATAAARGCVRIGESIPDDPRLQHVFVDWAPTLASRSAALSVEVAEPERVSGLEDVGGTCFSVEGVTASLDPPVDPGTYCFEDSGLVTGVKLARGTLVLTGSGPAPSSVSLPAAEAMSAPSTTAPSPTPTSTTSPSGAD